MSSKEQKILADLEKKLKRPLSDFAPGFKVQAFYKGKKKLDFSFGETSTYYDIASLTKTVFTTPMIMQAVDQGLIGLNDRVSDYLEWYNKPLTLQSLLTQKSGIPWWRPFYLKYESRATHKARWKELQSFLSRAQIRPTGKSVYSDLGFMLMGHLLEELFQKDLESLWKSQARKLGLSSMHYNVNNKRKYAKHLYAPTEKCRRRGKVLQGQVHDDNCYALGGVSSHAGLFGKIDDLSRWGLKVYRDGFVKSGGNILTKKDTFLLFSKRAVPYSVGDWALGWWKPSKPGLRSSAGPLFSKQSVGGLGFTGTSLWYDPKADLLVSVLSNRVHPSRRNKLFLSLRPELHSLIFRELV